MKEFYAHSLENQPVENWQSLEEHLRHVAGKAKCFADIFGGEEWAEILGYNHDLGKGTFHWQAWLRQVNGIIDKYALYYDGHPNHAALGARHLFENSKEAGKLLAYCISGHHGGLPNWNDTVRAETENRGNGNKR